MNRLYTPPTGYYDLPFMWVFDASALTDGANFLNQQVPIYAGYGDFILRRVVGLDRVLSNAAAIPNQVNPPGQFQIRDARGRYLQQVPQYVGTGGAASFTQNARDIAIVPEETYKENTQIGFDLWDILRATDDSGSTHASAQIGFQGVRRIAGTSPLEPKYKYRPKHFVYTLSQLITAQASGIYKLYQSIRDYDFELHQIAITYDQPATAVHPTGGVFYIAAVPPGTAGNGVTLALSAAAAANQALTISVAGNTVTVVLATDGLGNVTTSMLQLMNALNASLAVQAVLVAGTQTPAGIPVPGTSYVAAGGGTPITANAAIALLQLYDYNRVQVQSIPTVDAFLNRLSYDANGALVPPLWYPQQSLIELDVTTLQKSGAFVINVHFMGVRRIPC